VTIDSEWARRNLGIDEREGPAPDHEMAAAPEDDQALQRELIDFDSEGPQLDAFAATATAAAASKGLSSFVDIDWPQGLAPQPGQKQTGESLPHADVLIVTWTVDEGHALSRVLTPGFDSQPPTPGNPAKPGMGYWKPYTKNYAAIAADMRPGCPARNAKRLGTYWTCGIGDHRVTLFKSDSHMSQDGPKLPNATVWRQIIDDCRPKWVITTGTGGGIGTAGEVGDVLVSRFVTFDCQRGFKAHDGEAFACPQDAPAEQLTKAKSLFHANAKFLPADNSRPPHIVRAGSAAGGVLTTDFFGFDNTADTYHLQGKGGLSEMGDAVLGMVCKQMGATAPQYVMVRNVSDPQIDSAGQTIRQQTKLAADIYKAYGRWSTVCSAIVCWAIVAASDPEELKP
jgi:nucleoside phosphorylase